MQIEQGPIQGKEEKKGLGKRLTMKLAAIAGAFMILSSPMEGKAAEEKPNSFDDAVSDKTEQVMNETGLASDIKMLEQMKFDIEKNFQDSESAQNAQKTIDSMLDLIKQIQEEESQPVPSSEKITTLEREVEKLIIDLDKLHGELETKPIFSDGEREAIKKTQEALGLSNPPQGELDVELPGSMIKDDINNIGKQDIGQNEEKGEDKKQDPINDFLSEGL